MSFSTVHLYYPLMGLQLGIYEAYAEVIADEILAAGGDPRNARTMEVRIYREPGYHFPLIVSPAFIFLPYEFKG
jgi:hypothetical protein